MMRTTVTLDPDVESLLRSAMREQGLSFKDALNTGLRGGLSEGKRRSTPFVQKTFQMGAEQNFRWDKALAAAESMEDEEIGRKLAVGK